jgi:hypothetical protein
VTLYPIHVSRLVRVALITENGAAPRMEHPHILDVALLAAGFQTVGNRRTHRYSRGFRDDGEGLRA